MTALFERFFHSRKLRTCFPDVGILSVLLMQPLNFVKSLGFDLSDVASCVSDLSSGLDGAPAAFELLVELFFVN